MKYTYIVPILVLGAIAVSGAVFLAGGESKIAEAPNEMTAPQTNTDMSTPEITNEVSDTPQNEPTPTPTPSTPTQVATVSVNDILAEFTTDVSNEQLAYVDDGVSADMFAQSELSGFESDAYDY